jgi:hypothetical protein
MPAVTADEQMTDFFYCSVGIQPQKPTTKNIPFFYAEIRLCTCTFIYSIVSFCDASDVIASKISFCNKSLTEYLSDAKI